MKLALEMDARHFLVLLFMNPFVKSYYMNSRKIFEAKDYNKLINLVIDNSGNPYQIKIAASAKARYDYIVVGAGSAGAALASRLSEDPTVTVLVLDAGGRESNFSVIHANYDFLTKSKVVTRYKSVRQNYGAFGMAEDRLYPQVGQGLGGGTSFRLAGYNRGSKKIFDQWADMGAQGWSFDEVLPYFWKSEGVTRRGYSVFDPKFHSNGGPFSVEGASKPSFVIEKILQGIVEVDARIGDVNGRNQTRWNLEPMNLCDGFRCSSARSYLAPASFRRNLDIVDFASTMQVLIDDKKRAFGVKFKRYGKVQIVTAKKEIILCAGALKTPQILMLSGIGPRATLNSLGIQVKADLPGVGQNLKYHPRTLLFYSISDTVANHESEDVPSILKKQGEVSPRVESRPIGYYRTKHAKDEIPDIMFTIVDQNPVRTLGANLYGYLNDYKSQVVEQYFKPNENKQGFTIQINLVRPKVNGEMTLRSSNPFDEPLIDPKIYSDISDLKAVVEAAQFATRIIESISVGKLGAKPFRNTLPGCQRRRPNSPAFFACLARTITPDGNYVSGTCKMGSRDNPMAVVDSKLRVFGIKNLRIADASIMPGDLNANSPASAVMIGEKSADIIRQKSIGQSY